MAVFVSFADESAGKNQRDTFVFVLDGLDLKTIGHAFLHLHGMTAYSLDHPESIIYT
jgi:hypothetical protein